ncbi:MAG: hypothetical protein LBT38_06775 [Deltaproteobacteria bacterium]|jgi:pilus assembly protein CpaE|nr:hypothetical protein [Deltaproteobacteria bacterium]
MYSKGLADREGASVKAGLFLADADLLKQAKPLFERGGLVVEEASKANGGAWDGLSSGQLASLGVAVFDLRDQENLISKARELVDRCPSDAVVVVLGRPNDLDLYRNLKAVGVADYFAHPVVPDDLAQSVLTLTGLTKNMGRRSGRLITVHGVRGGLGSGLIASGLAAILSQEHGRSVAAVDSVLGAPTLEGYLGVNSPGNLGVVLKAGERLDKVLLRQVVQKPLENLALLTGFAPPGENVGERPEETRFLADMLSEQYRYQIWRSQSGSPLEGQLLAISDVVILLTGGSIPCVRAIRGAYQWILENNKSARIILVYNQVTPDPVFLATQLAKSLGLEFQMVIPFVKNLGVDLAGETPFDNPRHAFYKYLTALAKLTLGQSKIESTSLWSRIKRRFQ